MARAARAAAEPSGPLRLRSELGRTLSRLEGEIDRALGHAVLSPEDIHNLHRDLRRIASGMTVWERLAPTSQQAGVQEIGRRLRRLARLVGRVRDRDVTTSLFASPTSQRRPAGDLGGWREFLGRLRDDTDAGRELLRAFLRSEREGGLFDRSHRLLELAPRAGASLSLHHILAEERRLRQGRVRKAHRKARRRPTSTRLHRLRIRIRQWRHLASLEMVARATASRPPPPSWGSLQARLGRLHDLDVALATVPEDLGDADPARRLKKRRRKLRRSVRTTLERIASRPEQVTARARFRSAP